MKPRILLMSVGSGKTHLGSRRRDVFFDCEEVLDWESMRRAYPSKVGGGFAEYEVDFINLYFERILPLLLTGIATGRTNVLNLVTPDNAMLVGHLLRGLHERFGVGYVEVDPDALAKNIAARAGAGSYSFQFTHRGLLHAHANDFQLRGLASAHGLPTERAAELERYTRQPADPGSAPQITWREARVEHQLLEVLPGTWVELVDGAPCYLFSAQPSTPQAVHLECQRGTPQCSAVHGRPCAARLELTSDAVIGRWPGAGAGKRLSDEFDRSRSHSNYATWIPPPPSARRAGRPCVIGYTGSFAPFHAGHVEVLEIAKRHLEQMGYSVWAGYVSPWPFSGAPRKSAWHDFWLSWHERARLTYLHLLGHPWLRFDGYLGLDGVHGPLDITGLTRGEHVMQSIARRMHDVYGHTGIEMFWVNGDDAHYDQSFFESKAFANSGIRMCIVPRHTDAADRRWHDESKWTVCREGQALRISSTDIRTAVLAGDTERARRAVGDSMAYAYLLYLYHAHVR